MLKLTQTNNYEWIARLSDDKGTLPYVAAVFYPNKNGSFDGWTRCQGVKNSRTILKNLMKQSGGVYESWRAEARCRAGSCLNFENVSLDQANHITKIFSELCGVI